jgi:AbrB family looped-hinge helix DNA binding protein
MMASAKISQKGWVVIPVEYRRRYGLEPGDSVQIVDYGGVLALVPRSGDAIEDARGMLPGASLTKALLHERAREKELED